MRGHDAHYTAHAGIQTSGNDAQDNIFAGEDAGNPGMRAWTARRFHDTDRGRSTLAHDARDISNGCSWADHGRLGARVHDGGEVRQGSFLAQCFDVGEHGCGLRVCTKPGAKLALDASECTIEFLRRGRTALDLVQGFMEDFGDIKQANDVTVFVADRLR